MPQIFRVGKYLIYFWMNEGNPREPVQVHIAEGTPSPNSTKIWITQKQKCIVASNEARIPHHTLNLLLRVIEGRAFEIISKWQEIFGEIRFYCQNHTSGKCGQWLGGRGDRDLPGTYSRSALGGQRAGEASPSSCPDIVLYCKSFTRRTEQPLERENLDCGDRSI